jgi:hypothetical protein
MDSKDPAIAGRRAGLSNLLDALEPGRDKKVVLAALKGLIAEFPRPGE